MWVYLPTGHGAPGVGDRPVTPVVVVLDGEVWLERQSLPTTVDNLIADGEIPPTVLVFVDSGGRDRRWAALDSGGPHDTWVVDVLLPWVRGRYPVSSAVADVVVAGQSLGGLSALRLLIEHPEVIGAALAQSASLWLDDLVAPLKRSAERSDTGVGRARAYVEVGAQEWVLREPNRRLAERLRAAGVAVDFEEYDGGHDYACWRVGIASGLRSLLRR